MRDCVGARTAKGQIVHVDASPIRVEVSWESLVARHVEAVETENGDQVQEAEMARARNSKKTGKFEKVCLTDPDASMATSGRNRRLEPCQKQHGVVDDVFSVFLEVEATAGEVNEDEEILARLDAVERTIPEGERIAARHPDPETAEIYIRVALMGRFDALGTADIVRVA